jgi:two-component system chemotaxis response regulator CheB
MTSSDPIPVVICSSKTEAGSDNAIKALEYGAVEIIQKPKMGTKQFLEEARVSICDAVKAARLSRRKTVRIASTEMSAPAPKLTADVILPKPGLSDHSLETTEKIFVVGASTGGTEALREFHGGLAR